MRLILIAAMCVGTQAGAQTDAATTFNSVEGSLFASTCAYLTEMPADIPEDRVDRYKLIWAYMAGYGAANGMTTDQTRRLFTIDCFLTGDQNTRLLQMIVN